MKAKTKSGEAESSLGTPLSERRWFWYRGVVGSPRVARRLLEEGHSAWRKESSFLTGASLAAEKSFGTSLGKPEVGGEEGSGGGRERGRLVLQESHSKLKTARMQMEVRGLWQSPAGILLSSLSPSWGRGSSASPDLGGHLAGCSFD